MGIVILFYASVRKWFVCKSSLFRLLFFNTVYLNDSLLQKISTFVHMNLLRFILAFYFMALSLVPCEDVQNQSGNHKQQFFSVEESHLKDKGDVCSPLCVCNCCQMTVTALKLDVLIGIPTQVQAYFSKKILFRKNNFAYQVYDHIWQPPKI